MPISSEYRETLERGKQYRMARMAAEYKVYYSNMVEEKKLHNKLRYLENEKGHNIGDVRLEQIFLIRELKNQEVEYSRLHRMYPETDENFLPIRSPVFMNNRKALEHRCRINKTRLVATKAVLPPHRIDYLTQQTIALSDQNNLKRKRDVDKKVFAGEMLPAMETEENREKSAGTNTNEEKENGETYRKPRSMMPSLRREGARRKVFNARNINWDISKAGRLFVAPVSQKSKSDTPQSSKDTNKMPAIEGRKTSDSNLDCKTVMDRMKEIFGDMLPEEAERTWKRRTDTRNSMVQSQSSASLLVLSSTSESDVDSQESSPTIHKIKVSKTRKERQKKRDIIIKARESIEKDEKDSIAPLKDSTSDDVCPKGKGIKRKTSLKHKSKMREMRQRRRVTDELIANQLVENALVDERLDQFLARERQLSKTKEELEAKFKSFKENVTQKIVSIPYSKLDR